MNAAFCCASLGIVPTVRHADYIGSWLEVLREDNRAIVRAASQASKAADYILGFLPEDDPHAPAAPWRPSTGGRRNVRVSASGTPMRAGSPCFRFSGFPVPWPPVERERAGRNFVTGWRPRERLSAARRGETIPMALPSEDHPVASRDIPFNKLVLSQSNVRRVKAGVSIEELAEDIARRTLLQSLNVRPVLDAEGAGDRHVRDPGRRPPLSGRSNCW